MKAVFIVWGDFSPRAEDIAAELGPEMQVWWIDAPRLKHPHFLLPLRYLAQTVVTLAQLLMRRPGAVFVQNPPIFAPLAVMVYARLAGARFVIDTHTGAFNDTQWAWSAPLLKWIAKSAAATLVHNQEQVSMYMRDWHSRIIVSDEPPPHVKLDPVVRRTPPYRIQVISSFAFDEPTELVFQAAQQLPEIEFHVTGNPKRLAAAVLEQKPANVILTGFLPREEYWAQLAGAHAVMVLTTRDQTMQLGAWEAMFAGQPLILSDQATLRAYFTRGALFTLNTVDGIVGAVREMPAREATLRREMQELRQIKHQQWEKQLVELQSLAFAQEPIPQSA